MTTPRPADRASTTGQTGQFKIVVGVDYGTTSSGVAFVTTNKTSEEIFIVTNWPNNRGHAWKTPSAFAYATENPRLDRNNWGFEVKGTMKQYIWTKLLLDRDIDPTQHDDPLLQQMYGSGFLKLPRNKSAKDVTQDYLGEIHKYTMKILERELSVDVLNNMPIEFWITMPAIWSDRAQADTRAAAIGAGFGSRAGDSVKMITEPEAAALWALKPYLGPRAIDPLKAGEHVLVCDCGGGTVDLVTYEILAVSPSLEYRERCRGTGAKCGSTSVDRHFVQWMTAQFGDAYTSLDLKKRGPGSNFMDSFDRVKRNFGDNDQNKTQYLVEGLEMELEAPSLIYDEDEGSVTVSRSAMASFFQPALKELMKLVEDQATQLAKRRGKIDRFVLVGGFGDSPHLNSKLKEWCQKKGIRRFTCPADCQAAIVRGAVLRGLHGIRPKSTIAKRHYGWAWSDVFREGVDDEEHAYVGAFDNAKRCRDRMHWAVRKGQELDESFKVSRSVCCTITPDCELMSTLILYSCPLDTPPEHASHFSVRRESTSTTLFAALKEAARTTYNARLNCTVYQFDYDLETYFRSETGVLTFRSVKDGGQEAGTTTITFDG